MTSETERISFLQEFGLSYIDKFQWVNLYPCTFDVALAGLSGLQRKIIKEEEMRKERYGRHVWV